MQYNNLCKYNNNRKYFIICCNSWSPNGAPDFW